MKSAVAAFPVPGPREVVGHSGAGVLDEDLRSACLRCLEIPREQAIQRAAQFTWQSATEQFVAALTPMLPASSSPINVCDSEVMSTQKVSP